MTTIRRMVIRAAIASMAIVAMMLAHTPFTLPTSVVSLVLLFRLWRGQLAPKGLMMVVLESIVIGSIMTWSITRCLPQVAVSFGLAQGLGLHGICCIINGGTTVVLAIAIWLTRGISIFIAAPIVGLATLLSELAQARLIGLTWAGTNYALSVAATPIAQWSGLLTPFGISFILTIIAGLMWPDLGRSGVARWSSTVAGLSAALTLWFGGMIIESSVQVKPLGFTAMMVQPNRATQLAPVEQLDRVTSNGLAASPSGKVDLILWPEAVLSGSLTTGSSNDINETRTTEGEEYGIKLSQYGEKLATKYQSNCLIGATKTENGFVKLGYQSFPAICRFNCGVLFDDAWREIDCHEKIELMPISEAVPDWMRWLPELQQWIYPGGNKLPQLQSGRNYHSLAFQDHAGIKHKVAVAICYESWLPWLPQFDPSNPVEAVCHLARDEDFIEHPEVVERMLLAVRLRAIETRTWQLVCSYFRGTAVIDPRGRIVKQLGFHPGVLRTDELEQM